MKLLSITKKTIKNCWQHYRYLTLFTIIIFVSIIIIAVWVLYDLVYSQNQASKMGLDDRIALASLWVSIIGFALAITGALIAVFQFQSATHKPDLHLWIDEKEQTNITVTSKQRTFRIILENQGKSVARYTKIKLDFHIPRLDSLSGRRERVRLVRDASGYIQNWQLTRTAIRTTAVFIGGDEYICYDEDWDIIGIFRVNWNPDESLGNQYQVGYELRCEGMKRKRGALSLEIDTK